jgi:hypothetical protein
MRPKSSGPALMPRTHEPHCLSIRSSTAAKFTTVETDPTTETRHLKAALKAQNPKTPPQRHAGIALIMRTGWSRAVHGARREQAQGPLNKRLDLSDDDPGQPGSVRPEDRKVTINSYDSRM